jgi:hypothetical protein
MPFVAKAFRGSRQFVKTCRDAPTRIYAAIGGISALGVYGATLIGAALPRESLSDGLIDAPNNPKSDLPCLH